MSRAFILLFSLLVSRSVISQPNPHFRAQPTAPQFRQLLSEARNPGFTQIVGLERKSRKNWPVGRAILFRAHNERDERSRFVVDLWANFEKFLRSDSDGFSQLPSDFAVLEKRISDANKSSAFFHDFQNLFRAVDDVSVEIEIRARVIEMALDGKLPASLARWMLFVADHDPSFNLNHNGGREARMLFIKRLNQDDSLWERIVSKSFESSDWASLRLFDALVILVGKPGPIDRLDGEEIPLHRRLTKKAREKWADLRKKRARELRTDGELRAQMIREMGSRLYDGLDTKGLSANQILDILQKRLRSFSDVTQALARLDVYDVKVIRREPKLWKDIFFSQYWILQTSLDKAYLGSILGHQEEISSKLLKLDPTTISARKFHALLSATVAEMPIPPTAWNTRRDTLGSRLGTLTSDSIWKSCKRRLDELDLILRGAWAEYSLETALSNYERATSAEEAIQKLKEYILNPEIPRPDEWRRKINEKILSDNRVINFQWLGHENGAATGDPAVAVTHWISLRALIDGTKEKIRFTEEVSEAFVQRYEKMTEDMQAGTAARAKIAAQVAAPLFQRQVDEAQQNGTDTADLFRLGIVLRECIECGPKDAEEVLKNSRAAHMEIQFHRRPAVEHLIRLSYLDPTVEGQRFTGDSGLADFRRTNQHRARLARISPPGQIEVAFNANDAGQCSEALEILNAPKLLQGD